MGITQTRKIYHQSTLIPNSLTHYSSPAHGAAQTTIKIPEGLREKSLKFNGSAEAQTPNGKPQNANPPKNGKIGTENWNEREGTAKKKRNRRSTTLSYKFEFAPTGSHYLNSFPVFGWFLVRVRSGLFPLVWVMSAAKLQPPFLSPALRSLHGRPDRSGSL